MAARVFALVHTPQRLTTLEVLRAALVCACALALIGAERVLPTVGF